MWSYLISQFFSGLDLSAYVVNKDEPQPLYDLYAVSNHYGGLGGGFMYTLGQKIFQKKEDHCS